MRQITASVVLGMLLCADCQLAIAEPQVSAQVAPAETGQPLDLAALKSLAGRDGFRVYPGNPLLSPGAPGEWDAGAIGSVTVALVDDQFHMYYEAWGRPDPNAEGVNYATLQIGHATSPDGVHWQKDPANPVLPKGALGEWDAKGTWDPFVLYEDGRFKLWYGGGIDQGCDWGYAESDDGQRFAKRGRLSQLHHVEDDHVIHDEESGKYFMYYWNRQHEPRGLFRAESTDETNFDFVQATPIRIEGDSEQEMNKFTHVIRDRGRWFMFYADFVRPTCDQSYTRLATSDDGIHWKSANRRLFAGHDADILPVGDSLYLAYFGPRGRFDAMDSDVRLAIFQGGLGDLAQPDDD